MQFYPRALVVTVTGLGLLAYSLEHRVGLVAIGVEILLTGGLWTLLPDRSPSERHTASRQ
jgi:hypothetical protein